MGKERVLEGMARRGVDVLLLGREGNARYVSGAGRLFLAGERAFVPGCVIVRQTGAVHLLSNTDFGVPETIPRGNLYPTSWNPATLVARVAAIPGVVEAQRIGVDGLTPLFAALLPDVLRPGAELVDGEAIMRAARRVKTPPEIDMIRAAAAVADAVMRAALDAATDGRSVKAVATEAMAAHGVTTAAFEPRVLREDGRVTIAVGVLREGWEADVTRTNPDVANTAIQRCRAGARVDELGADLGADLGANASAPATASGTGVHGVGLGYEVLSPDDALEPGMVLSIGQDGVRDTVLVTAGAAEVLTRP